MLSEELKYKAPVNKEAPSLSVDGSEDFAPRYLSSKLSKLAAADVAEEAAAVAEDDALLACVEAVEAELAAAVADEAAAVALVVAVVADVAADTASTNNAK